jgi:hypothetical protein
MAAPVAPGVPVITSVTPNELGQGRVDVTVQFGFTTPIPPAVYSVVAGRLNNPLDPGNRTALTTTVGTAQSGTVSIAVNTIYYIWGAATANGQTVFSTPLVFNGANFGKPGTPFLVAQNPAENTYTWNFITEDIGGSPEYSFVFSPNDRTDSPPAVNVNANPTSTPGTFVTGPASIPIAGSPVYIWGRCINNGAEFFSQVPLVFNVGGSGTPPSGPSSTPAGIEPRTNTQLAVTFNTNGVTGTPPLSVNCLASASPNGPYVKSKFPEVFGNSRSEANRRPASVVAPATRSSGVRKVQLTTSAVALAKKFGMTPQQYAAQVAKLEASNG